jgi:hypothetical protein
MGSRIDHDVRKPRIIEGRIELNITREIERHIVHDNVREVFAEFHCGSRTARRIEHHISEDSLDSPVIEVPSLFRPRQAVLKHAVVEVDLAVVFVRVQAIVISRGRAVGQAFITVECGRIVVGRRVWIPLAPIRARVRSFCVAFREHVIEIAFIAKRVRLAEKWVGPRTSRHSA